MTPAPQRITRIPITGLDAATAARPAQGRMRSVLHALFASCPDAGPMTPNATLRGAEVWRCERCGSPVVFADELTPEPPHADSAANRSLREPG